MVLDEVEVVGAEALEGGVDLLGGAFGIAGVDLGHEEGLVAVAVAEGHAHALFADAVVVVPGVVEEVDAGVEGGADDLDADGLGDVVLADVGAADADDGDEGVTMTAEGAAGNAAGPGGEGGEAGPGR